MSSNPSPLPAVSPSSSSSSSLLSAATSRLPLSVEKARSVIDTTLALLRAILRDPASSITASDGRFISARDSLRALHLEIEDRWFESQLEVGNGASAAAAAAFATAVSPKSRGSRTVRGPRKPSALGSSPLGDLASVADPSDTSSASVSGRSSLLVIAGVPAVPGASVPAASAEPLGADDIPDMPGEERI